MNTAAITAVIGYKPPPNGNPGIVPPWLQFPVIPLPGPIIPEPGPDPDNGGVTPLPGPLD